MRRPSLALVVAMGISAQPSLVTGGGDAILYLERVLPLIASAELVWQRADFGHQFLG